MYGCRSTPLLPGCRLCKWVMGSERRRQAGCVCSRYLAPSELFKVGPAAAGRSGPGLTRPQAAAFDRRPSDDGDTRPLIYFKCYVMLWLSLCGRVDTSPSTGCFPRAQWGELALAGHCGAGGWQVLPLHHCVTVCLLRSQQHSCCSCSLAVVPALPAHCSPTTCCICACTWWRVIAADKYCLLLMRLHLWRRVRSNTRK